MNGSFDNIANIAALIASAKSASSQSGISKILPRGCLTFTRMDFAPFDYSVVHSG
jgi:hypothetical protein